MAHIDDDTAYTVTQVIDKVLNYMAKTYEHVATLERALLLMDFSDYKRLTRGLIPATARVVTDNALTAVAQREGEYCPIIGKHFERYGLSAVLDNATSRMEDPDSSSPTVALMVGIAPDGDTQRAVHKAIKTNAFGDGEDILLSRSVECLIQPDDVVLTPPYVSRSLPPITATDKPVSSGD